MWKIDKFGNACNGIDKAIVIQVELSNRFDVSLFEQTCDGFQLTPLKVYLPERAAIEYVRKLVDVLNSNNTAETVFVKIAHINAEETS